MATISLAILDRVRELGHPDSTAWEYLEWSKKFTGHLQRGFLSGMKGSLAREITAKKRKRERIETPQQSLFHPEAYETPQEEDLTVRIDYSAQRDYFLERKNLEKLFDREM